MSQAEIRERVTNQIVEALKQGVRPWVKPWNAAANTGSPANVISKNRYKGVNPMLLEMAARRNGWQSQWWGTFKQWASVGGQVKRRPAGMMPGSWGTKIIFFKPIKTVRKNQDGEEEERTFPMLREFTVFNAAQVEGVDKYQVQAVDGPAITDFEPAEEVIEATDADIRSVPGNSAHYIYPPVDVIEIPPKNQFTSTEGYYETMFHELVHWTEPRLNYNPDGKHFSKESLPLRELRAEMGSAFLCTEVGIPTSNSLANHVAYLENWLQALQNDHRNIFRVASAASQAVDYILSFSRLGQEAEEETVTA